MCLPRERSSRHPWYAARCDGLSHKPEMTLYLCKFNLLSWKDVLPFKSGRKCRYPIVSSVGAIVVAVVVVYTC